MAVARPWVLVVSHDSDTVTGSAANTLPFPDVMMASIRPNIPTEPHQKFSLTMPTLTDFLSKGLSGTDLDGETDRALLRWFYLHSSGTKYTPASSLDASTSTAILGDNNPTPTERNSSFHQSLNTDSHNRILGLLENSGDSAQDLPLWKLV
ncbi:hypothetical protein F0562_014363 [Nyssa sinensis]|uniref:Uncharacterized protein n=1 Tax=Nyssa sinensis TaxID=561372 RepID=A0A5J4ZSH6_9ASTE|nr:hypothetical protein F0562_014363 [Nyssa sinensis]